jgi:hypothetical protein
MVVLQWCSRQGRSYDKPPATQRGCGGWRCVARESLHVVVVCGDELVMCGCEQRVSALHKGAH